MKEQVDNAAEQDKERITGRLRLVNAGIESLERKRKVDVVDRQISRHRRNSAQQQQCEHGDPEKQAVIPTFFHYPHAGARLPRKRLQSAYRSKILGSVDRKSVVLGKSV